jgi:[ribosomal protein S18]-alanine N-acetyltransferase
MIELVSAGHARLLAEIHKNAFPPDEAWSESVLTLQLELLSSHCLLDQRGGFILLRVMADEAEIVTLAVSPAARRQGIGDGLLRAAKDFAVRHGATRMFLEVAVGNTAALALYAKNGFCRVGRRRRYYANGADALVMRADLGGTPA